MRTPTSAGETRLRGILTSSNHSIVFVDADDTLWYDGRYFRQLRSTLVRLGEIQNIDRSVVLDTLEKNRVGEPAGECGYARAVERVGVALAFDPAQLSQLSAAVNDFLAHPIEILPAARETVANMTAMKRILLTKGNYGEQKKKLMSSSLDIYFESVVVVEKKSPSSFATLCSDLGAIPSEVIMIGNSIQHDIVPAIESGANAIWMNHSENDHGRNGTLPMEAFEVHGWNELLASLL